MAKQSMQQIADAMAIVFKNAIANKTVIAENVAQMHSTSDFPIPNPRSKIKAEKEDYAELRKILRYRHGLEVFVDNASVYTVCPHGWLSNAPKISDEDVDKFLKEHQASEIKTEQTFKNLMTHLGVRTPK